MADDGGLSSFQKRMRAIPQAVQDAVRPAMERSAEEICTIARGLCPVDDGVLKASIGWTWGAAPQGSISLGAVSDGSALSITVYAGNDAAFYARWVEFGTAAHALGKGSDLQGTGGRRRRQHGTMHPGAAAQPFFFPAYRLGKKRAMNRIKRAIGKAVKEKR